MEEIQNSLPEPEETPVSPAPRKKLYAEHILAILALVLAGVLIFLVITCRPYFGIQEDDPLLAVTRRPVPTAPEEVPPGETVPGEPQPEKSPYGPLDFQYDGRYLGCIKAETVPGIDVSKYQGIIDWQKVKESGIEFVIVRIGYRGYGREGKIKDDDYGIRNIQGALAAGLKVGVYFFSQAITPEEAVEEAEFVLRRIRGYNITMPVVFDWEYVNEEARTANMDPRTLTDCYLAFSGKIAEAGYTPMAYFNSYQSRNLMHLTELEEYPFWLALYSDRMTYPYHFEMWQYSDNGRVPGIEGPVDLNLYFVEE